MINYWRYFWYVTRPKRLAEWRGASRLKTWEWYAANKDRLQLSPDTRAWIEAELARQKRRHDVDEFLEKHGYN